MPCDPLKYHRRSIRLEDYDYSQSGAYFVTISTHRHRPISGTVSDEEIILNPVGQMVGKWWWELTNKFHLIETDVHVVMPNHFHGILMIVGADLRVCPDSDVARRANVGAHAGAHLPQVVQWFKTMTTNEYIRGAKAGAWPRFSGKLWQRNYYEHIIRNEKSLNAIREYISLNPLRWENDPENPECNLGGLGIEFPVVGDWRVAPLYPTQANVVVGITFLPAVCLRNPILGLDSSQLKDAPSAPW